MEISENTLSIMKNFSGINQNMLIKQGNTIRTITEARNVLATAVVDADFPQDFGIYDLNEFIGSLSLVDAPNLDFNESFVTIGDSTGRSKIKYFFSPEETLTTPSKDINMPAGEVKFVLDNETLSKIRRAASTLGHDEVLVSNNNGTLTLSVVDSQNSTSNSYAIDISGEFDANTNFNFILNITNLKIISGDYDVEISSKNISHYTNKSSPVEYWIALEPESTYKV